MLIPKIENEWGLTLILEQRDFEPEYSIFYNICNAVEKSKKKILVLTPSFYQSELCEAALQFSLFEGIESIIPIFAEVTFT